ncbi:MAG: hypothetical protein PPP58_11080 [Natronomonas sp.]
MDSLRNDDRGVSEVIGFVLIVSLILTTIGIVFVGGLGGLEDARDFERVNNAERAFDVFANNLQKTARGEAPNRATEISLSAASIEVVDEQLFSVSEDGQTIARQPRPIVFSPDGSQTQITYETGAVIRSDGSGSSVMVREPDFLIDDERMVIRVLDTRGGQQSIAGDTTVLIRTTGASPRLRIVERDDPTDIQIQIESEHTDAWERYLEGELRAAFDETETYCTTDGDVVVCGDPGGNYGEITGTIEPEELYYASISIDVELS